MGLLATLTGWRLLRSVLRLVGLVVAVVLVYFVVTGVQVFLTGRRYEPRAAGAIVVMGAAQYNGVPSPDLRSRLDEAELLWQEHYATDIMVTGYKEPGDQFTEAEASARYLVDRGIPGRDILEAGGDDSWQNLSEAAPVLLAHGDRVVLIATDPFHEDRSLPSPRRWAWRRRPPPRGPRRSRAGPRCRTTPRRRSGWGWAGSSGSTTSPGSTRRWDDRQPAMNRNVLFRPTGGADHVQCGQPDGGPGHAVASTQVSSAMAGASVIPRPAGPVTTQMPWSIQCR